jgi:hypothetical protein
MTRWILKIIGRYSYIVTLLVLCFLCFALNEAKAETQGLPYQPTFEAAAFPFARVLTSCTQWRRPTQISEDQWGAVSFAGACQAHDQCFHTPADYLKMLAQGAAGESKGISWSECNRRYLKDLRQACNRDLKQARLAKGELGEADPSALQLCYEIANMYFEKAQTPAAVKRFEISQRKEEEYLDSLRGLMRQTYKEVLGRAATAKEVEQGLLSLFEGQDFGMIKESVAKKGPARAAKPLALLEDSGQQEAFSLASPVSGAIIPASGTVP